MLHCVLSRKSLRENNFPKSGYLRNIKPVVKSLHNEKKKNSLIIFMLRMDDEIGKIFLLIVFWFREVEGENSATVFLRHKINNNNAQPSSNS